MWGDTYYELPYNSYGNGSVMPVMGYGQSINDDPVECEKHTREYIENEYGYDLSHTLDEIWSTYRVNVTSQDTVYRATSYNCFLESTDFEDVTRNDVSFGGDSDTLAAITGSIAETAYNISD